MNDSITQAISASFSSNLLSSTVLSEQKMGFSGACVMELECKWEPAGPPSRLFIKNIILENLPDEPDARAKALRNRQSYKNEIAVINTFARDLRDIADLSTAKTYNIINSCSESSESYLFISDTLNDTAEQMPVYDTKQCQAVLKWMARMHAYYWGKLTITNPDDVVDPHSVHSSGVWNQGSHLALSKRPTKEVASMVDIWEKFTIAFNWPELTSIGNRLATVAPAVSEHLAVQNPLNAERTTLIHGDFKPGNIFFQKDATFIDSKNSTSSVCELNDSSSQVNMIDFQWTGLGHCATDVAYLLAMCPSDSCLESLDIDADFLIPYYTALSESYSYFHDGNTLNYTIIDLKRDFQLAVLDFVRWVVPARLANETPEKYEARRNKLPWDLNMGAYRRSSSMMHFLMTLTKEYLVEAEKLIQT